jgi:hypothetical protein
MGIASRTPEGDPNRCPVCGHRLRIDPAAATRDAPCPRCGHLLWFQEGGRRPGQLGASRARELAEELLLVGAAWWGDPPPAATEIAYAVEDLASLERVQDRFTRATNWAEFIEG